MQEIQSVTASAALIMVRSGFARLRDAHPACARIGNLLGIGLTETSHRNLRTRAPPSPRNLRARASCPARIQRERGYMLALYAD